MAKSLRSKWKRKMRAIKRVRYGAKELIKLKEILATAAKENAKSKSKETNEAALNDEMTDLSKADKITPQPANDNSVEEMQVDKIVHKYKKNLQDQFGNYPIWLNPRHVKQRKKAQKRMSKVKKGKIVKNKQKKK